MTRARWALFSILAVAAAGGAGLVAADGRDPISAEQPFVFPHDRHAGDLQIPCMYCHSSADVSTSAGIPALSVCAGCHLPGGAPMVAADSPGVKILIEHWNQRKPIAWERAHDLADHVTFPHFMHINAGLECQECHGNVAEMEEVERVSSLRMGWCVECHRARAARTDCTVCHY